MIEVSNDLSIEFDQFEQVKSCEMIIRNNHPSNNQQVKSIDIENPMIVLCGDYKAPIKPMQELKLGFQVNDLHGKCDQYIKVRLVFGTKLTITRSIKIDYQPRLWKNMYDVPDVLQKLFDAKYKMSRSKLMDNFDKLIPSIDENYTEHFHNLLFLEEIGLRDEIKREYSMTKAVFGDQDYVMENKNLIRKKHEVGVYELKLHKDIYETRPSLQICKF